MDALRPRFAALVASLLLAAACGGGGGGGGGSTTTPPPPTGQSYTDPNVYSVQPAASLSTPNENVAVTQHSIVLDGATLSYTATAGHMTATRNGAPQASFFYVAYTLNGAAPSTRPVTFFYNGGPGSASIWLHIGSFGPKRLATSVPAMTAPTPFELVDNAESLLDVSDLVFVDAVGVGYSQAIAPNTNSTFWGVDADAAVFRDFVMRYVAVNNRASSPKYLFGESYGGPRTAVLADLLESAGVTLAGVVLQSPAMNYNSSCDIGAQGGEPCTGFFPSYAATGAWFNRANPSPPPAQIPSYMGEMRTFAAGPYDAAARAQISTGAIPGEAFLAQLAGFTGWPAAAWAANMNPKPTTIRANLVPGLILGRYDSRITLSNANAGPNVDPSSVLISNSFGFRFNEYTANTLKYTTPSTYTVLSNAIQTWNFSHDGNALPDTIPDLAAAMAQNPQLRVLAVNGYHDLATPFFTTERDLARLGNNPRVQVRNYMGGHMTYLDDDSRRAMKTDLKAWYGGALAN